VRDGLRQRSAALDPGDDAALADAAAAMQAMVRTAGVPDALRAELLDAYHRLGADVSVAVRSSATAEDTAGRRSRDERDLHQRAR